jgi:16S rRNA (cytosine967-C5)-methyltransferase
MMKNKKPKVFEGLESRYAAQEILTRVLLLRRPLDEAFEKLEEVAPIDRTFVRVLVLETLRRYGSLQYVLAQFLEKELPEGLPRLKITLEMGLCQILFLETSPHAAVHLSVELARMDRKAKGFDGLINAVLRRVLDQKEALLATIPPLADMPTWLIDALKPYGEARLHKIAEHLRLPDTLDITVKSDAEGWASKLDAEILPSGSLRLRHSARIPDLEGFASGEWFVQNASSAIPARLLDAKAGEQVLDLCAAPGGKTAQLCLTGATVTALDRSAARLTRLSENLTRLKLHATVIKGDALTIISDILYDAILLDAPCSATGTLRGNPDISLLKSQADVLKLAKQQLEMLTHAATLLKKGGRIIFCTCSMQREEGEDIVAKAPASLKFTPFPQYSNGMLRILPDEGSDGFFAAQFIKL